MPPPTETVVFVRSPPSLWTDVERRVRGTAEGDRLLLSCPSSTETASLTALNCVLNSVVSDDAFFGTIDLTDFYLGTPVTLPLSQRQYIRIDVDTYSPAVLFRLSLYPFIHTGTAGKRHVVFRIDGLKDAGKLSQLRLVSFLAQSGFLETQIPPMPLPSSNPPHSLRLSRRRFWGQVPKSRRLRLSRLCLVSPL
jgi:hypothetical protein